jgi:hypothetical protein
MRRVLGRRGVCPRLLRLACGRWLPRNDALLALAAFAAHRSALLRPHPKRKEPRGTPPRPPVSFCTFLRRCSGHASQVRSMEPGNPSRHFIGSWRSAGGTCSSQPFMAGAATTMNENDGAARRRGVLHWRYVPFSCQRRKSPSLRAQRSNPGTGGPSSKTFHLGCSVSTTRRLIRRRGVCPRLLRLACGRWLATTLGAFYWLPDACLS